MSAGSFTLDSASFLVAQTVKLQQAFMMNPKNRLKRR